MTAPCLKCGFDPHARVIASWSTFTGLEIVSGNSHVVNAGRTRWKYAETRRGWEWAFRAFRLAHRIPRALTKRRVTLTRCYDGRQRELDVDNLAAGAKVALDALVREGLLVDDRREFCEVYFEQKKASRGTVVLIEELASDVNLDGARAPSSTSSKPLTEIPGPAVTGDDTSLTTGPETGANRAGGR